MRTGNGYRLSDICEVVDGRCFGVDSEQHIVRFLLTDSRKLLAPDTTLFFALKTKQNDGHHYIPELLKKGVRSFVTGHVPVDLPDAYPDAAFLVVDNPLMALQTLAARHRSSFDLPVVAITGSNGKTVIKEWLFQSLSERQQVVRNPKSYNSQIGVPLSVWNITADHDIGIFEAGISRPYEMSSLRNILKPDTGIFTNIGPAHDEGFPSRKGKIREKLRLFQHCKTLIYCSDQPQVHEEIREWHTDHSAVRLFTWGEREEADVQVVRKEGSGEHTLVAVLHQGERLMLSLPFGDNASVENALHCLAYLTHEGYDHDYIIRKLSELQPVAMRLEMKEGVNDSLIINDSYNSDLHSLTIALDFLNSQSHNKKKTLILSDILESGIAPEDLYAEVAMLVLSKKVNRLIGIGPEISQHKDKFSGETAFFDDTETFIRSFDVSVFQNEAILLKGARVFGFERLSTLLQQKDHQTVLEIDLDALTHNLTVFKSLLAPSVKIMGVVKAFSYGTGSIEVARALQHHQVDYLSVAYADEGKELRRGGVKLPVVVMNPEVRTFETLLRYQLEPEIYGFPLLRRLLSALEQRSGGPAMQSFPVHIKMDTGMHRLGFLPGETDELIDILTRHPHIKVASVFSHLAASEDERHDAFTREQIERFTDMCDKLEKALGYGFLRHICNSAAVSRFPEAHFDMVRAGIGLYGVTGDPDLQPLLQHVGTFRSVVSQVKRVKAGETIGYGRAGVAYTDMEIAIIPVGYADGLNRRLGNGRGKLLVKGHYAPIVGNINMDMCTVDVTGKMVQEGDDVVIFGADMPVTELARDMNTIPYEVLTAVSQRVKRVFFQV